MAVFQAALVNELEKLYKKKKALVALLISIAIIVIGQILIIGIRNGFGIRGVGSVEFPLLVLSIAVNSILPLFTALVTIDCFSGEFSHNLMRVTLTRPVSRFKIFSAKITAIALFITANLFLLFVFSMLAGFLFNANSASVGYFLKTVLAYSVSLLPVLVLALAIALLANMLRNGTSVFFVSILAFLGFKALGVFFSSYASILITSQLDWYQLWMAHSFPVAKIVRQLLIMIGYAIMFFTAGYYLFDKKEF